jgi:hypothetical protein
MGKKSLLVEPISPELVLVDPDLARRVRMLSLPVPWTAPVPAIVPPEDTVTQSPALRRSLLLAPGALLVGLLCLVALQLHRSPGVPSSQQQVPTTVNAASSTSATATVSITPSAPLSAFSPPARHATTRPESTPSRAGRATAHEEPRPRAPPATTPQAGTRVAAERAVLLLLQTLPGRLLPRGLVDPITALVKTDVQATCRRTARTRFRCVLLDPVTAQRVAVVYRSDRSGAAALSPARPQK